MFNNDKETKYSLKNSVVKDYFFDQYDNTFIGLRILNLENNEVTKVVAKNENRMAVYSHTGTVSDEILDANDSTRLVGFRTGKSCKDSTVIKSIQPIYYSNDANICKSVLNEATDSQLRELPAYGADCSEPALLTPAEIA